MRISDWSSDVCSSDLRGLTIAAAADILGACAERSDRATIFSQISVVEQALVVGHETRGREGCVGFTETGNAETARIGAAQKNFLDWLNLHDDLGREIVEAAGITCVTSRRVDFGGG